MGLRLVHTQFLFRETLPSLGDAKMAGHIHAHTRVHTQARTYMCSHSLEIADAELALKQCWFSVSLLTAYKTVVGRCSAGACLAPRAPGGAARPVVLWAHLAPGLPSFCPGATSGPRRALPADAGHFGDGLGEAHGRRGTGLGVASCDQLFDVVLDGKQLT